MNPTQNTHEQMLNAIATFNAAHPVGTLVRAKLYPDRALKTKTEAMTLFDSKAVIYLEGFNGYFDLHEVTPDSEQQKPVEDAVTAAPAPAKTAQPDTSVSQSSNPIAVIFPGQGAQKKGMGKDLFAQFPELVAKADAILGYSIEQLCIENPANQLAQTQFTQPALFIVNALGFMKLQKDGDVATEVQYFAGHSLGEYNALHAAGVFDFETGLKLAIERGRIMSQIKGGAMAAVLRTEIDMLKTIIEEEGLESIDLANFNTPTQTVITGPADDIEHAIEVLSDHSVQAVALNVSGAFHSRYMKDAEAEFDKYLETFTFEKPHTTVIANATGLPYQVDDLKATLGRQISSSVLWRDSVDYLLENDVLDFVEVSSKILTNMVNEIRAHQ